MKAFLGIFLVSVLLTIGASLKCETCIGINESCSGHNETCPAGQDACVTITTKTAIRGVTGFSIVKGCSSKALCNSTQHNVSVMGGSTIQKIECTDGAAPVMPSIFLTLSGLLLMKLLL